MLKYQPLEIFLRKQHTRFVPLSFKEIERLIGAPLPPSSRKHRAWWSNNPSNSVITEAWLNAGFRTEQVDMEGQKLIFRRAGPDADEGASGSAPPDPGVNRHPLFGALKGTVRIAPGIDLTQPADPEWGEAN